MRREPAPPELDCTADLTLSTEGGRLDVRGSGGLLVVSADSWDAWRTCVRATGLTRSELRSKTGRVARTLAEHGLQLQIVVAKRAVGRFGANVRRNVWSWLLRLPRTSLSRGLLCS